MRVRRPGHGKAAGPAIVAVGPERVLERRGDGSWSAPPAVERERLILASVGDPLPVPTCHGGPWFWLGAGRAWFACDDLRTFRYDKGKITPTGKRPSSCRRVKDAATLDSEVQVVCADNRLWEAQGRTWQAVAPPEGEDRVYSALSVAGNCVFLAGRRTVWRRCAP